MDQQECTLYEWLAAVMQSRLSRNREPLVQILGTLSDRGRRFQEAVARFAASHPLWNDHPQWDDVSLCNTASAGFPDWFKV